jgi:integrase/recombinase XerD
MTALKQRMMADMKLHGLAPGTQHVNLKAVRRLAAHYMISPDQLSEQQLRDYFTYLVGEKHLFSATLRTGIFGVRFLFDKTLQKPWPTLKFLRARPCAKLPAVLDREEAQQLIALILWTILVTASVSRSLGRRVHRHDQRRCGQCGL